MSILNIIKQIQGNDKNFTEISLDGLDIGSEESAQLIAALKKNNIVTNLKIWYCKFENIQDPVKLMEIFRFNNSITTFSISGHYIQYGDLVFHEMADALKHNCILTSVNLYYFNATNSAIESIADSLHFNKTLQKICLEFNACEEKGLKKLAEALAINNTVKISFGLSKPETARALEIYNQINHPWVGDGVKNSKNKSLNKTQLVKMDDSCEFKNEFTLR